MLQQTESNGPLVVKGEIKVDGSKFPVLRRALERGRDLAAKERDGWAQVAELRRTRQDAAADRLIKEMLGVKGDPMPENVKAALRAKRAAMTEEEKRGEREDRRANRVLKRLAARAVGGGMETHKEDDMATKTAVKKAKGGKKPAKAEAKAHSTKKGERDPRIPAPGSIIKREYKGKSLEVKVLAEGFEFDGEKYTSLSALAKKITGAGSINGLLFFHLTETKKAEAKYPLFFPSVAIASTSVRIAFS